MISELKKIDFYKCQRLVNEQGQMEVNKPSIAVAEKIGFTNVFNYVGYEFPFE